MFFRCLRRGLLFALTLLPLHVAAGEVDDVVARAAQSWLADWATQQQWPAPQIEVSVVPPRRPAPQCGHALQVVPLDTSQIARLRFSANCPNGASENYTVRAMVRTKALAASHAMPAGQVIDKSDLQPVEVDVAMMPDVTLDPEQIAGHASQRPLHAGQAVRLRFLKAAAGVRRGELVEIVARQAQFQISAQGTAMQKGDGDALVRVRNEASGKLIMARVIGPGRVEPVAGVGEVKAGGED